MKKALLLLSIIFGLVSAIDAQVTSVNYQIKYNESECQYDAYIIINAGSANTVPQRIQFNAQYSIVVPTGSDLTVTASYMPLQQNQTYTGTLPLGWEAGTPTIAPAAQPTSDFYSITPDLGITSHYNNLNPGDTIKLFSFELDTIIDCAGGIRIFKNGIDPASGAPGMGASDFSNGFTLGSINQIFSDNSAQGYPPLPEIVDISNLCNNGLQIDITAETSACQLPMTYVWSGPNGYSSTDEDVNLPVDPANNGVYEVVITDALGCKDSISMEGTSKPNAGPDLTTCPGSATTIYGSEPTTGTWTQAASNDFGLSLSPLAGGSAEVIFSEFASGIYDIIYTIPGCSDTMQINVLPITDPACLVGIEDVILNDIKVYPNPAQSHFIIEGKAEIEAISINSMSYQKVKELNFSNGDRKIQVSTEALDHGFYIIAIKSDSRVIYKKLLVENSK